VSAVASSSTVTPFFKSSDPQDKELNIAAKEATFAYHTAAHDLSFKMADCSSKPISQFFNVKFSLAWMKCEGVILNVLAPLSVKELKEDLK
jgi:hypothetical protein